MTQPKSSYEYETDLIPLEALVIEITSFVEPVMTQVVDDFESKNMALASAKHLLELKKRVEAKRVELVGPLNERVKLINDFAKRVLMPITAADNHLRSLLIKFEEHLAAERAEAHRKEQERLAKEAKEREERVQAAEFFQAAKPDVELEEFQSQEIAKAEARFIDANRVKGTFKRWTFEIENESEIPVEFKVVSEPKLREAIKRGTRHIPGVRIFEETRIAVR